MNLDNSSATPLRPLPPSRPIKEEGSAKKPSKWLIYAIIAISFIGFLDASYLTINHYRGTNVGCSLTGGCEKVLTSEYALIFNIPVALIGALFYLTVFILALIYTDLKKPLIIKILAVITALAFLSTLRFVYIQLFVLKSICQYCMLSAITSTLLFILSLLAWRKTAK